MPPPHLRALSPGTGWWCFCFYVSLKNLFRSSFLTLRGRFWMPAFNFAKPMGSLPVYSLSSHMVYFSDSLYPFLFSLTSLCFSLMCFLLFQPYPPPPPNTIAYCLPSLPPRSHKGPGEPLNAPPPPDCPQPPLLKPEQFALSVMSHPHNSHFPFTLLLAFRSYSGSSLRLAPVSIFSSPAAGLAIGHPLR